MARIGISWRGGRRRFVYGNVPGCGRSQGAIDAWTVVFIVIALAALVCARKLGR